MSCSSLMKNCGCTLFTLVISALWKIHHIFCFLLLHGGVICIYNVFVLYTTLYGSLVGKRFFCWVPWICCSPWRLLPRFFWLSGWKREEAEPWATSWSSSSVTLFSTMHTHTGKGNRKHFAVVQNYNSCYMSSSGQWHGLWMVRYIHWELKVRI